MTGRSHALAPDRQSRLERSLVARLELHGPRSVRELLDEGVSASDFTLRRTLQAAVAAGRARSGRTSRRGVRETVYAAAPREVPDGP